MYCRFSVNYKVHIYNLSFSEVIMTSENFKEMYDAKQFLHWLACQVSTPIPYQITMDVVCDGYTFHKELPKSMQPPVECKHYPVKPLTRSITRKRCIDKEKNGFYYEY